jgi:DNA polymerase elongation subunit (family B)
MGEAELGYGKQDYAEYKTLYNLYKQNYDKFVDYNIMDVKILVEAEKKKKFFKQMQILASFGASTVEKTMKSVGLITGSVAVEALQIDRYIPSEKVSSGGFGGGEDSEDDGFEGAYVKEPIKGLHDFVVSYDANSLYPNTVITLNLSAETKMAKKISEDDKNITVKLVKEGKDAGIKTMEKEKWNQVVDKFKLSLSSSGVFFRQDKKGIFASLMDYYYQRRVEVRKLYKKATDEEEKTRLDTLQYVIKIFINSVYGAMANKYFCLYDLDLAESITLTGQAMIKKTSNITNKFLNNNLDVDTDNVLTNDTDSEYLSMYKYWINKYPHYKEIYTINNEGKKILRPEVYDLCDNVLENHINTSINKWSADVLNSKDSRYYFKREHIAVRGLFVCKKHYALWSLDKEGSAKENFKYTGIKPAQNTLNKKIKEGLKFITNTLLTTGSKEETDKAIEEVYKIYDTEDWELLSEIKKGNNFSKFENSNDRNEKGERPIPVKINEFSKGAPMHIKAAFGYNRIIKKLGLENKYEYIESGDNIRFVKVKKNNFGLEVIAFKTVFPEEFKEYFKIDTDILKENQIYSEIESYYTAIGWISSNKPTASKQSVNLLDLFS